ncbi:neither inactivation nor afterpotential protein G-like isoform X2 [Tigriopus californicus]|uniref:neither inactivation nor afterpotential protein G-like isoform X2 n=1 Tax=Tigriopus californicus TaxID=6832 RepID=UPI0027DA3F67|nr:neither inactivation nor afterpotential protein G-like isoform X2 [Tigriopus californicus]
MWKRIFGTSLLIASIAIYFDYTKPVYRSVKKRPDKHYDYIIVGGGTGGSVLASELSSNPAIKVLLIEAGGHESWISRVPLLAPMQMILDSTWNYQTVPQSHSHVGFHDQISTVPRGKFVGGTGNMNFYIHNVSSIEVHPKLVSALETSRQSPLLTSFIASNDSRGIFSTMSNLQKNGQRLSMADIFLKPAMNRDNLHVMLYSEVLKLYFKDNRVEIVEFRRKTNHFNVTTLDGTQVVLCGGSINTPLLLLNSGIGPKSVLRAQKVSIVKDLPVGQGLSDHVSMPLYFHVNQSKWQDSVNLAKLLNPKHMWEYWTQGTGLWSSTHILGQALFPSDGTMILLYAMGAPNIDAFTYVSNMKRDTFNVLFPEHTDPFKEGFIMLAICLKVKAVGSIKLGPRSVTGGFEPLIDPNFLSQPADLDCLQKAVRSGVKIGNSMSQVEARYHLPKFPECDQFQADIGNDDYVKCMIRVASMTMYHPIGTMAHEDVLNENLSVKGLENLFVVDGSAIGSLPSRFPNEAIIHLALKFAEQRKEEKGFTQ